MTIEQRKKTIMDMIDRLFGDTSVTQSETKGALEEIQGKLEGLIDTLDDDQ